MLPDVFTGIKGDQDPSKKWRKNLKRTKDKTRKFTKTICKRDRGGEIFGDQEERKRERKK